MIDDAERAFALTRLGTRFADAQVEERYHAYRVDAAVTSVRVAFYLLLIVGISGIAANVYVGRGHQLLNFVASAPGGILLFAAMLATYTPGLRPWVFLLVALGMAYATAAGVVYMNWAYLHDPVPVSMHAIFGWTAMFTFVGFAALRLPPIHAACALAPPNVLAAVLYMKSVDAGRTGPGVDVVVFCLTFIAGLAINVLMDGTLRRLFRQEHIVEAQKEVIARSEALLQRELGHQVAARSRELGQMLQRVEASFVVGRLSPGDRFDERYVVKRALGAGAMAVVYEVHRTTDNRRLALKLVTGEVSGPNAARFAQEAEIGARVRHPNVISIVDVGISSGAPFLAMEMADGGSLEEQRARFGDAAWAMPVLREIAAGVAALHEAGVVHRDLKPANVLFSGADAGALVTKISDFGISRFGALDSCEVDPAGATVNMAAARPNALTATGALLGTPFYMAPESARGGRTVDAPADVFAFGIIACEMLTGRAPFSVPAVFTAMACEALPSAVVDEIRDGALRTTLAACLAENPAARPTMRTVAAVLAGGEVRAA